MRHLYECPLRWADVDMLGHVNNVTYVDYLQEARVDMFALHAGFTGATDLAEGVVVVRHEVDFVAPLAFRPLPVRIEVWITEVRAASFTMAYEVYDETDAGERRVYLRASSLLAPYVFAEERPRRLTAPEREVLARFHEEPRPRSPLAVTGRTRHVYPMKVRFSDVDVYRHVNNVRYFEYFQEARVQYLSALRERADGAWSDHAVARTDVDYRAPLLLRREPYDVHSWISRVGTRSLTLAGEIRDGDRICARASVVLVAFDRDSQRATDMGSDQRRLVLGECAAGADVAGEIAGDGS